MDAAGKHLLVTASLSCRQTLPSGDGPVPTSQPTFLSVPPAAATADGLPRPSRVAAAGIDAGAIEIEVLETMAPLEAEWRRLEADPNNALHQGYDWCAAWASAHQNPLAIVRGRIGDETVFILPLEIVRSKMVRVARFIAGPYTNINTGLFCADFWQTAPDAKTMAGQIKTLLAGRADLVALQNIPFDWRGARHPLAGLAATPHQNHTFQLPLLSSFEQTLSQLNAKRRRKKFKNQTRRLEAAGGFIHVVATKAAEKHALLEMFFLQKANRFQALGLPDVFRAEKCRKFFHALLDADNRAPDIALQLHAIHLTGELEGRIAAIAGLSRKGDHVICQFGSIDDSVLPDASPGELLFWLMIEQCNRQGVALFDFGLGDQGYKRSWCTVETVQHDILLPLSAIGRVSALAERALIHAKRWIKANPRIYAQIQRLRAGGGKVPPAASEADGD
jgi:CelD/BcsL family acetyltransferase involved in cellulose biosynthesis